LGRGRRGGFLRGLGSALDALTKTGVVLGGLFAAWQYWEAKVDKRVERTMEYIVRYEDGRVGDARRRIDAGLRPYLAQFQEIAASGISEADRNAMVLTIVTEARADTGRSRASRRARATGSATRRWRANISPPAT
jgi:hypothetical protein